MTADITEFSFANLDVHPEIVVGLLLLQGVYLLCVGPLRERFAGARRVGRGQSVLFTLGVLVLAFATLPPLHDLSEKYLFSAHMVQHLLMVLVAAPLLLAGTPGWLLRPLLRPPSIARFARFLTHPLVAFVVSTAVFNIWHMPAFFDAAVTHNWLHGIEHVTLLASGLLMWWPIVGPVPELPRPSFPVQMLYIFLLAAVSDTPLFVMITFSDHLLYTSYANAPPLWGLSPLEDQRLGGIIMKEGGMLVFLGALIVVFFRWFNREEAQGRNSR